MPARVKLEDDPMVVEETNVNEDDEVVREIDVFISPALSQQLYLLQYPLQHAEGSVNIADSVTQARIKPRHQALELKLPLPEHVRDEPSFTSPNTAMTQRTFQSQTIPVQTHLCLGKMSADDSLHLVPLNNIRQMRPSFAHLNKSGEPTQEEQEQEEQQAAASEAAKEKKSLVFQRKESERAAMARKSSYAYKKTSEESEAWQELVINNADSATAILEAVLDTSRQVQQGSSVLLPGGSDEKGAHDNSTYIQSLNYLPPTGAGDPMTIQYTGNDLKSVTARLTTLMHRGFPIPYSLLRKNFDTQQVDDSKLLSALSVCAVLVRGNFLLNSRFLPTLSDPVKRARTFILLLLQERGVVERKRLMQVYPQRRDNTGPGVSAESLLLTLQQVAKKTPRGWILKVEDDDTDRLMHFSPETYELHQAYWRRQAERYEDAITLYDS